MTLYTNMKFPDYEFREFPKFVTPDGGEPVLVQNAEEEAEALKTGEAPIREEDERKRLIILAEVKGVQIDKRWSAARMTKTIEDAGFDPTLDPRI